MSTGRLHALAAALGATVQGADAEYRGVSIDSREVGPGMLFVALRGERHDAHGFLDEVARRGAAGAVVERLLELALPQILVPDTRLALGRVAQLWRARFTLPVIGVTGSNGKTTVKEMIAAILARSRPTLATRGNFNNDVGLPLTLLRLGAEHRVAVIELGTNRPGEIAYLAGLAAPELGVITNAAPAHLAGFGTVAAVAREKGALIGALPADGVAVLNADDPELPLWRGLCGPRRVVTFGVAPEALYRVERIAHPDGAAGLECSLHCPEGELALRLQLLGAHNAVNAACAAAAAAAAGASPAQIVEGLAEVRAVPGRMRPRKGLAGARLIDDSYNANPASMRAAIAFLGALPGAGWLVIGDMAELGAAPEDEHAQLGRYAREHGVARLFAVGPLAAHAAAAFGTPAEWYPDHARLVSAVSAGLGAGINVLVKGSRSAQMDRVADALSVPETQASRGRA